MDTKEEIMQNAKELKNKLILGGKKSKRPPDSVDSLIRRIHVVAKNEGKEVKIKVRRV